MNTRDAATRAETVGSLLRPPEVIEALRAGGQDEATARLLDKAVLAAIAVQQDAGLDVITDGEMRRLSWAQTPRYLDCFEGRPGAGPLHNWRGGDGTPMPAALTQPYPIVVRRVAGAARRGNMADEYAFLAAHAHTRTKYCLAAPSYHRRHWSGEHSRQAYSSCEEYLSEVRDFEREIVTQLVALGCDYIQLDAPNYGSYCDPGWRARAEQAGRDLAADIAFDAALDSSLLAGLPGVTRALHICRGNAPGGRWHSAGGYGAISAELFPRLDFDRLLLEYDTGRAGGFGPLAAVRPGTVAVLGLLTTKSGQLEAGDAVAARITEAARVKPLAELAVSTQCGFASGAVGNPVTPAEQAAKLGLVASLARRMWPR